MITSEAAQRIPEVSPRIKARIAGAFYLVNILTGALAAFLVGPLAAYGETALLIAASSYVVVTLLLYAMFKPVNSSLALLAAFFSIIGIASGKLAFFGFFCLLVDIPAPNPGSADGVRRFGLADLSLTRARCSSIPL
ncbi:MAG TPA: hypothetical protein VGU71_12450 [Candidatus Dormibacteraeota bacterium]|nr:hypothetical protein [Candidatus Dormibacteraeota bacterium]